ncbi:MAG: DNA circularization N-terminal domain-containing protein [Spirochaetes bacterium]|nr:DNA circularization N-terminal domain-containing protein [Spirochaetota bacterium]
MSDWQDRVRPYIKLTSPKGQVFKPGWKGDEITVAKRVGRHAYPGVDKEVAQDMGLDSDGYPLTLLFEGPDNDLESKRFLKAWAERGVWTIVHPVDGTLYLQPLTATRANQPIRSGNLTTVTSNWMEPLPDSAVASSADSASDVDAAAASVSDASAGALAASIVQDTVSETAAIKAASESSLAKIKKAVAAGSARINAIQAQIQETISETPMDVLSLAGEVTQLMQSPGLIAGAVEARVQALVGLGRQILADLPAALSFGFQDRNAAETVACFANAVTVAIASTITSELPDTRSQALSMLSAFRSYESDVVAALDGLAAESSETSIDRQFFGHGGAVTDALAALRASVSAYLLSILFDLKTERRFTLERPRATFEIAITEYPATAETADYFYDLFCRSNKLIGRQVLLLPAGWEVVVYV